MDWIVFKVGEFYALLHDFVASKSLWDLFLLVLPFLILDLPRYLILKFVYYVIIPPEFRKRSPQWYMEARSELFRANPLVSVIIPALNEEETIENTIRSLQEQTFKNLEIIVADDASTDRTTAICREFASKGMIKFVRNETRGGKSAALNHALSIATGQYVIAIDSDTLFKRDAFEKLLYHFHDPKVGAVGGNLHILNSEVNVMTAIQTIEYLVSISAGRTIRSALDVLYIISGAFGAYRHDLLKMVSGYDVGPGEDSDATAKIRKKHFKVAFEPDAICYTKVPVNLYSYIKQRFRWNTSMIKIKLRKHGNILNPNWDTFSLGSLIGWIDLMFFQVVLSITFIIYLFVTYQYFSAMIFFVILIVVHAAYTIEIFIELTIAWFLTGRKREFVHLFLYTPLYTFHKGYLLRAIRASAYLGELLFRVSYSLPFVPDHVRAKARRW